MNTSVLLCNGLRGNDPLGALASFGLITLAERADLQPRLAFRADAGWRAELTISGAQTELVAAVVEALVGSEAAAAREHAEAQRRELMLLQTEQEALKVAAPESATARKARSARLKELQALIGARKRDANTAQNDAEQLTKAGVAARHPVTTCALHLDDVTKGGLSREALVALALAPDAAPYLHGLASAVYPRGKKTLLARSAFSFSNNNSGKQLLKDFAALASLVTPARVEDALFGDANLLDPVTGLGWDPGSQKSYALQFGDPGKGVTRCNATHHALAFYGLAMFPVVPLAVDRLTLGIYALPADRPAIQDEVGDEGDGEEEPSPARSRRGPEQFTWPLWEQPLPAAVIQALLVCAEFAKPQPDVSRCRAMGVSAVMRSRRFSLNKRSYLAPARPVA